MDDEIQAAQARLLHKREQREAMGLNTPSMRSIDESLEAVIEKAKQAAQMTGKPQYVPVKTDGGDTVVREVTTPSVRLKWAGVPKSYLDCSFDTFAWNEKLTEALKNLCGENESVVLMGNTGCGKTHLAVAMMREIGRIWDSVFTSVPELLLKIRASFRDGSPHTEEEIINRYTEGGLLILDDLGAEKSTEYSITTLYLIIDRRIRDEQRTIITTNLTMDEIEQGLGARIASRLSAMRVIKIGMPDYRKRRGSK